MPKVCLTCGHENADDADFCASCGTYLRWELTGQHAVVTPPQEPSAGGEVVGVPPAPAPPSSPEERGPSGTKLYPQAHPGGQVPVPAPRAPDAVVLSLRLPGEEGAAAGAPSVDVAPGTEATIVALVRNSSGIVDNYDIAVTGLPAGWWTATPSTVYLVPFGSPAGDYEQEIEIRLHPPIGPEAEARPWPLRVTVSSRAHGSVVASAPATLAVGAFHALETEIRPEQAGGRRKADFAVAVRNRANAPVEVQFSGADPEGTMRFDFQQPRVVAQPGHRAGTAFSVRPPKQIIIGKPVERRFEVLAQGVGGEELMLKQAGAFRQKAWLPRWLLVVLLFLAAVVLALWLLLTTVPNVVGMKVAEAQQSLEQKGLEPGTIAYEDTDDESKIETVKSQEPAADKWVRKGRRISLIVWRGTETQPVPDLVGKTLAQAEETLSTARFQLLRLDDPDDPATSKITSQIPLANEERAVGTVVEVSFKQAETGGDEGGGDGGTTVLPTTDGGESGVAYPDFVYESGGDLLVASGNDGEAREPLTQTPDVLEEQPVWNPKGTRIAYRRGPNEDSAQIWLMNPKQPGRAHPVTDGGSSDNRPAFSPTGKVIAFTRGVDNGAETDFNLCFVRANARSAVPSCIEDSEQKVSRPVWSPNGQSILVIARDLEEEAKQDELLLYSSDVKESASRDDWFAQGFVTEDKHGEDRQEGVGAPAWSSDGLRIAFAANWEREAYYLVLASPDVEGGNVDLGEVERKTLIGACEVAWIPGREELAITRRGDNCDGEVGEIGRLDLSAPQDFKILKRGNDPSWQPPGG